MASRTWRWLQARIYGLLATESRTARAVLAAHKKPPTT